MPNGVFWPRTADWPKGIEAWCAALMGSIDAIEKEFCGAKAPMLLMFNEA